MIIKISPKEIQLKRMVRSHLNELGYTKGESGQLVPPGLDKSTIRKLHTPQRTHLLKQSANLIHKWSPLIPKYFASGSEVNVERIAPRLERVNSDTWQSELFKLASLSWSVPVSPGFGRRLRFLVWDEHNNKLIGLLAIGDPVFNLSVRDSFIGWTGLERRNRLVNVLDAYVLGALPPYNMLLGGKLVACIARSVEIYDEFHKTYNKSIGVISGEAKEANLLAITTSSSMGRSSVYNRLKLKNIEYFKNLGFSGGWGHFHVTEELFDELRKYLRETNHSYADTHAFGDGPNWRIRTIRAALNQLGFKGDMLKHGVKREVFISLLADNSLPILRGETAEPCLDTLHTVREIGELARERWMVPRASTRTEYLNWSSSSIANLLNSMSNARVSSTLQPQSLDLSSLSSG